MNTPWSDLEAKNFGFECDAGGLTIADDLLGASNGHRWLSWEEAVRLHLWLRQKILGFPRGRSVSGEPGTEAK